MARNTLSRSLHDLGLSAWFGGTLANAVALNAAAAEAGGEHRPGGQRRLGPLDARQRRRDRRPPGRQRRPAPGQQGPGRPAAGRRAMSALKTLLTAAALGVTAYSRALGPEGGRGRQPVGEVGHQAREADQVGDSPPP